VCECGDTLHFNGVHFFKRVVEDSWGVDDLPSKI